MGELIPGGLSVTPLNVYVERLGAVFRAALGDDLSLDPETVQGRLIRGIAPLFAEVEQLILWRIGGFNLNTMAGGQLDDMGALAGIVRRPARVSVATVTLSGVSGSVIPSGTRFRSSAGDVWQLSSTVTIGPAGSVTAAVQAQVTGPVTAPVGAIAAVVDGVVGLAAVANEAAAVAGVEAESDEAYRRRIAGARAAYAAGSAEAVRARVLALDDVTDCVVLSNSGSAAAVVKGVNVDAGSVHVIVRGAAAPLPVATAILTGLIPGSKTSGAVTQSVWMLGGSHNVKFTRASEVAVKIAVNVNASRDTFSGDSLVRIRSNVVQWWRGTFNPLAVPVAVGLGVLPDASSLYPAVLAVPGVSVRSVSIAKKADSQAITAVRADQVLTLVASDVVVDVDYG
ncbi:MAG: baseplate J/gp47 family protein [Rhodospirillaceae bacterium]|nr:baseplate J/gp47 family protein [Rhodospirillaceae bacterium]